MITYRLVEGKGEIRSNLRRPGRDEVEALLIIRARWEEEGKSPEWMAYLEKKIEVALRTRGSSSLFT